jgi:hypothetical protein
MLREIPMQFDPNIRPIHELCEAWARTLAGDRLSANRQAEIVPLIEILATLERRRPVLHTFLVTAYTQPGTAEQKAYRLKLGSRSVYYNRWSDALHYLMGQLDAAHERQTI